ncbi:MAG: carboxypeptidase-like regulatory domain-containing protein [Bacteroidales bacterium]
MNTKAHASLILLLMLTFCFTGLFAQNDDELIMITGTVFCDETKEPLANANILFFNPVKQQIEGSVTNKEGEFKLQIPKQVHALTFAFEDMKRQRVELKGKTELEVFMEKEIVEDE